jgi:ribonuclease Z
MSLQVIFLGTAASVPTVTRALPSVVLKRKNEILMFDCGEGVQRQMIKAKVGFHKKMKIFVSHMHGDHVLGLPGVLQTMSLLDRSEKLEIYGPIGIKAFIRAIQETVQFVLTFPLEIHEIEKECVVCEEKEYLVQATGTDHLIPSLGYAFDEKPRPGRFDPEKAKALGVPEGPLWSQLQRGERVKTKTGKEIRPQQVVGPPRLGIKIVYSGDTRPTESLAKLAKGADLLIHEATLDDELVQRAKEDGHSTPKQAAKTAKKAKVKKLILTHISSRYKGTEPLLEHAKRIFSNVDVAEDFMNIEIAPSHADKTCISSTKSGNLFYI